MPTLTRFTDNFLWQKRQVGDARADEVIQTLLLRNQKGEVGEIFKALARTRDFPNPAFNALPADVRDLVEDYFAEVRRLPDWVRPFKLEVAADVFRKHGPKILMVLLGKSLPTCYTCWRGAKVLAGTGRLLADGTLEPFTRRLMETAQFVVNLLTPNAFAHDGRAIVSIQKVRLMHAAIRYFAQEYHWDRATYGVPINQQDLVGTLLSFSVVIADGLGQLGIELEPEEKSAWYHLWHLVGVLMGIDEDLLSEDEAECRALMQAILDQQAGPSPEGVGLTRACLELMEARMVFGPLQRLAPVLMRFFIGDRYAEMLEIPATDEAEESSLLATIQNLDRNFRAAGERNLLLAAAGRAASAELIEQFLAVSNRSHAEQFSLPSALTDTWRSDLPPLRIPPVTTVAEAIFYLDKVTWHLRAQNNPIGLFAAVYRLVTQRVAEGIERRIFENNERMEEVDVKFANRYFDALNHYFDGTPASPPWQVAFDAARKTLVTNQHIFASANAHITYDLGIVVVETFPGEAIHAFKNDFDKMNQLFDEMYDQMNDSIARVYRPFGFFVRYFGEALKAAERRYMSKGRALAWQKSIELARLTDEAEKQRLLHDLGTAAAALGRAIVRPPLPLRWPLAYIARQEQGTPAQRVDVMLRSALLPTVS